MITHFLATCQRRVSINCTSSFLGKVHVSLTDCVQQLISLFRSLCITLGKPYSDKKVRKTLHFQIHVHFLTLSLKLSIFEYIFSILAAIKVLINQRVWCYLMQDPLTNQCVFSHHLFLT